MSKTGQALSGASSSWPDRGLCHWCRYSLARESRTTPEYRLTGGTGFAAAASANLPALLYNLFWKRFNTMGATFSIYGGLIMAVLPKTFSPVVSGTATSLVTSVNFDWFLLRNPS